MRSQDEYPDNQSVKPPRLSDFRIFTVKVAEGETPERLDLYLARMIANTSRTKVRDAIDACAVFVNNEIEVRAAYKIKGGDEIEVFIPRIKRPDVLAEDIPLDIVFEDDDIIVINKPPGMIVHPSPTVTSGTLLNALMHYMKLDPDKVDESSRAGIVHRLDKDTSGLLVAAKNELAHRKLAKQFFDHTAHRVYQAIVWGIPKQRFGKIETQVGRDPKDRKLFTVLPEGGKTAITEYIVADEFSGFAFLELKLQTGRTHQIRVHMQHLGHPVFGDPTYGGRSIRIRRTDIPQFKQWIENILIGFPRQALHARTLRLYHPRSGELMEWTTPTPGDMQYVIDEMKRMSK